MQTIWTTI